MRFSIDGIVMEGGGVRGIAHLGAIKYLSEHHKDIIAGLKYVGGASAGAINACLLGLNYNYHEAITILKNLNFNDLLDTDNPIDDFKDIFKKFGYYNGNKFHGFIREIVNRKTGKPDATFEDIEKIKYERGFLDMKFIGTNLSRGGGISEVFSFETTPKMSIAMAVRCSMSIPLFFEAVRSKEGDLWVDGGVANNYPIRIFDREKYISSHRNDLLIPEHYEIQNKKENLKENIYCFNPHILGLKLEKPEGILLLQNQQRPEVSKIDNIKDYLFTLVNAVLEQQDSAHLIGPDYERTCYIPTLNYKTTQFNINDNDKEILLESGHLAMRRYIEWKTAYEEGKATLEDRLPPMKRIQKNEKKDDIDDIIFNTNDLLGPR